MDTKDIEKKSMHAASHNCYPQIYFFVSCHYSSQLSWLTLPATSFVTLHFSWSHTGTVLWEWGHMVILNFSVSLYLNGSVYFDWCVPSHWYPLLQIDRIISLSNARNMTNIVSPEIAPGIVVLEPFHTDSVSVIRQR